jgi:hypothetical protein
MAQDDLTVANASGAAVRADINANLQALGTLMSGATAPSTTLPFLRWADTANDLLKQRNAANSAWIVKETLSAAYGGLPASSIVYAPGSPSLLDATNVQDAIDELAPLTSLTPSAYALFSGTTISKQKNVSSITKNATGDYTLNFTTALASTAYLVLGNQEESVGAGVEVGAVVLATGGKATGSCRILCLNATGTALVDPVSISVVIFGP